MSGPTDEESLRSSTPLFSPSFLYLDDSSKGDFRHQRDYLPLQTSLKGPSVWDLGLSSTTPFGYPGPGVGTPYYAVTATHRDVTRPGTGDRGTGPTRHWDVTSLCSRLTGLPSRP